MEDKRVLARLRITPAGPCVPVTHTISLEQIGSEYYLAAVTRNGLTKKQARRRVAVSKTTIQKQLAALKRATVPAFPVSPMVCDGSYLELTVEGEFSTLTLGWWTIAPEGAECLSAFADWLSETGLQGDEEKGATR